MTTLIVRLTDGTEDSYADNERALDDDNGWVSARWGTLFTWAVTSSNDLQVMSQEFYSSGAYNRWEPPKEEPRVVGFYPAGDWRNVREV